MHTYVCNIHVTYDIEEAILSCAACLTMFPPCFRILVESRRSDMPKDSRHMADLIQAVRDNKLQDVQSILETRLKRKDKVLLNINDLGDKLGKEIQTALLEASRLKDTSILKYMLENGAQANFLAEAPAPGKDARVSPLHIAVANGLQDSVCLLLDSNADVNRLDHHNRSALHIAVKKADCISARMLLFRGANVNGLDQNGLSPLQLASKYGHVELVRILLEHSAQIFHEGRKGPSPLHIAALEGHVPLIDIFSRYVDVNLKVQCTEDGKEKTALHLAAERGLIETVRFLLDRFGASVNVFDSDSQTALHCALLHKHDHRSMRKKDDYDMMVELFLKKQVKVNHQNCNGDTALHFAAKNQFHHVVELLLLARGDPAIKNKDGLTALDLIPEFDVPMKQMFTKYGAVRSPSPRTLWARGASRSPAIQLRVMGGRVETSTDEEEQLEGPHRSFVFASPNALEPSAPALIECRP